MTPGEPMNPIPENIPQGLKPTFVAARDAKARALAYLEAKTPIR
jgi:hypothetical protein